MRIKRTQNLMLIADPLKNLQKNSHEKIYKQKNDFYYCVQTFSAYKFFWVNLFLLLFQRIQTQH
jgi:hypothetical protein